MTVEQRVEEICMIGFQRMTEGVTGFDYAAYVCNFHPGGLEIYQMLEPAGAVGVIALAAMNPQTRGLVNDPAVRPQLEAFLTDFFTFSVDGSEESPSGAAASSTV